MTIETGRGTWQWLNVGLLAVLGACGEVSPEQGTPPDSGELEAAADAAADATTVDAATADAARCVPALASLRARWRADDNADDETGVHPGTRIVGQGYGPGRHGSAFVFDGMNDLVIADSDDRLWPPGSFSVELWVQTSAQTTTFMTMIEKYACAGTANCDPSYWALTLYPGGHPAFHIRVIGGNASQVTAGADTVADGQWHHLVGVRDVDARRQLLYVDGELAVSAALEPAFQGPMSNIDGHPDPVTIGAGRPNGADTYNGHLAGAIDEVAYYEAALDADTVAALHAAADGVCH